MTLFVPSSRLLIAAGDAHRAQKLILASREWYQLQNSVQAVLALPYDIGEYQLRYGDASAGSQMKECFDAMHRLQSVALRYGSPKSLRANILKNPDFLARADRPTDDAFSSIVWTLQGAHRNAFALASALRSIPVSARGEKPAAVVRGIKSLFADTDQTLDDMQHTVRQLDALIRQLESLEHELEEAQTDMRIYTDRSSKTRTELDKEIGELKNSIAQLEKDRDAAYKKWLDLTIAAIAVSAGIAIVGTALSIILGTVTAGSGTAIGAYITVGAATVAGGALGTAAGIARTSYESLVKDVEDKRDLERKRIAYRHDLGALDEAMTFTLPASGGIVGQIGIIRDAWKSAISEIRSRINDLSVDNLSDGPWLDTQEMAAAAANWTLVDTSMKSFVTDSFVDYTLVDFGDPLPKDDPNWQQDFIAKVAA